MLRLCLVCICFFCSFSQLNAMEVGGVDVAGSIKNSQGTTLELNGTGIRTKLFFDIYVAALYLEKNAHSAEDVFAQDKARRLLMHFLYSEIDKETLVKGWVDGFSANLTPEEYTANSGQIEKFNAMFGGVKKGDEILLDYIPEIGTMVSISGVEKGVVEGAGFNTALLKMWLGKKPVTKKLKKALLAGGVK